MIQNHNRVIWYYEETGASISPAAQTFSLLEAI